MDKCSSFFTWPNPPPGCKTTRRLSRDASELKRLSRIHFWVWVLGLVVISLPTISGGRPIAAQSAAGHSYFVSPSGNDSNPGTAALPWKTIQSAANRMAPGDTVNVLAGNYSSERVRVRRSGASDAPIVFQAQGKVLTKGFTIRADDIVIRGFDVTATDDDWTEGVGIFVLGSRCLVENNYVSFSVHDGISLNATLRNPNSTNHCVVRNNRLYRNADSGIDVRGTDNLIEGNEIWGGTTGSGVQRAGDADGIRFFGSGHVIRGNYVHDLRDGLPAGMNPHTDCFQTWRDDTNHQVAQNTIFERNTCRNLYATSPASVGQGFMIEGGASNLLIRNNVIRAVRSVMAIDAAQLVLLNNVFAGDLSVNLTFAPIGITLRNSPNAVIQNCILYDLPADSIYVDAASRQGLDISHSIIYRSDGRAPRDRFGLERVNPQFVDGATDDFHLRAESPAIDAGLTLPNVVDDLDGHPRPQGKQSDIGPYEYMDSPSF